MMYDSVMRSGEEATRDLGDEEVVARVLAGETALFEVLMRRHNRRLFRAARAIVKRDDEAEDVMQEAYTSAFRHLSSFGGRAQLSTWLTRIVVNEALLRLRREGRAVRLDDAGIDEERMQDPKPTPEGATSDAELRLLLEEAVDALPVGYRTVFVMRAVEELSVAETAEALELSDEAVRVRLHRARSMLRDELARKLDAVAPQAFDFHLSRCDRVVSAVLERIGA
jgi:RNA polymerase sigma-70 factor (ECF subfamily)